MPAGLSRSKREFKFEHGQIRAHNDGSFALERVYMMKPLVPNMADIITCDFRESKGAFNSSQGALKPGEKIFDVHFIVNNRKQIVETNYDNNDVHAKPGVVLNPVKTAKD